MLTYLTDQQGITVSCSSAGRHFFKNCWCLQEEKHRSVCIALEPSSRYPAGSTEKQDPWLRALDPALAPAWLNPRLLVGVLAVSKILSNRLLFERRA